MSATIRIRDAEARLKAAGIPVNDFCKLVRVHRSTWQRWKKGPLSPTLNKWDEIEAALPGEPKAGASVPPPFSETAGDGTVRSAAPTESTGARSGCTSEAA